jgi:acyl-CoA reductase-like NAD-dependent aldehyde dehydrogenase
MIAVADDMKLLCESRFSDLERIISDAQEEGADVVIGGQAWKHPYVEEGNYFEATVVGNVSPGMEIAQQERAYPLLQFGGYYLYYIPNENIPNIFCMALPHWYDKI